MNYNFDIPDAPWIRETEKYGMPEDETFYCPVCGAENPEDFIIDDDNEVIGCECCTRKKNAYDWYIRRKASA